MSREKKQIKVTAHDEIIVTELRPMSELEIDGYGWLADESGNFILAGKIANGLVRTEYGVEDISNYIGYICPPKYQPETKKD